MEKCSSLLTGIIHINKHGNGFVDTKFDEDTFVKRENLNGAVDGDFVEIDVQNDEGIVVNILKRVDLPSPFGPITPTLSPSFIENVMFFNISLIP